MLRSHPTFKVSHGGSLALFGSRSELSPELSLFACNNKSLVDFSRTLYFVGSQLYLATGKLRKAADCPKSIRNEQANQET